MITLICCIGINKIYIKSNIVKNETIILDCLKKKIKNNIFLRIYNFKKTK